MYMVLLCCLYYMFVLSYGIRFIKKVGLGGYIMPIVWGKPKYSTSWLPPPTKTGVYLGCLYYMFVLSCCICFI